MQVSFVKTGLRRYGFVPRERAPELAMNPAPGYDDSLPHDAGKDLERVLDRLDELAERWRSLHIAEALTLTWPRPEGRRPARRQRRKSSAYVRRT